MLLSQETKQKGKKIMFISFDVWTKNNCRQYWLTLGDTAEFKACRLWNPSWYTLCFQQHSLHVSMFIFIWENCETNGPTLGIICYHMLQGCAVSAARYPYQALINDWVFGGKKNVSWSFSNPQKALDGLLVQCYLCCNTLQVFNECKSPETKFCTTPLQTLLG